MSASHPLPLASSALLVIDVQDTFKASPRWARRSNPAFEANVASLVAAYRQADLPIYFILHSDSDPGWRRDEPHYKLMDFLSAREGEEVLHKTSRNCFTTTELQRLLTLRGVRRLAITGIQTEQCCETTARVAGDLGYDVDFVLDATLTFPILHEVNGEVIDELSTEDIERRTAFVLRKRFARITATADLLAEFACV
jgi:nicotinamidase-related amidase